MVTLADFHRVNPLRPLDWRFQRAQSLVAERRRCKRDRDDDAVEAAVKFLRARRRWGNQRLGREMPELCQAVALHESNAASSWLIQARLLARQSPEEIAALTSMSPATIVLYERLFFNVTDRLNAWCYIAKVAIGLSDAESYEQPARVLRWFGYRGGPIVLDVVAPILLGTVLVKHADPGVVAKTKLLAALLTLPGNNNRLPLLNLLVDLAKTTRAGGAETGPPFAGLSERFIHEAVEILRRSDVDGAGENEPAQDLCEVKPQAWEAA